MTTRLLSCTVALLCLCTKAPLQTAGGTSDTGNPCITGMVQRPDSTGAPGALVRLRSTDYFAPAGMAGRLRRFSFETMTDDSGRFVLDSLETGTFRLEAIFENSLAVQRIADIEYDSHQVDLGVLSLAPFARLTGNVGEFGIQAPDSGQLQVGINGLERSVQVDNDGSFAFDDLPQGAFVLQITSPEPGFENLRTDTVSAISDSTTTVSSLSVFPYSAKIVLNTTSSGANIAENVYSAVLLVRLAFDAVTPPLGANGRRDIRFVGAAGQGIPHEIGWWDSAGDSAGVWIPVDTVQGNNGTQHITMKWGNPHARDISSSTAVFDTARGFAGAWHFEDRTFADATVHGFDGTPQGGAATAPGLMGNAGAFDGDDDYIDCGNDTRLDFSGAMTIGAWVYLDSIDRHRYNRIVSKKSVWYDSTGYEFEVNPRYAQGTSPPGGVTLVGPDSTLHRGMVTWTSGWHHCAVTVDGAEATVFLDGEPVTENVWSNIETIQPGDAPFLVGGIGTDDFLEGRIDELQVHHIVRTSSWVRLHYENQRPDQSLIRIVQE